MAVKVKWSPKTSAVQRKFYCNCLPSTDYDSDDDEEDDMDDDDDWDD